MKLKYLAVALLAVTSSYATAQSVTLYGIVDAGVEYVSHAGSGGKSLIRMPANTGELPSRWGVHGDEDLGGGLHTIFTLESGFNMRGGDLNQGGRLFGRQAWVGLSGPYGTVTLGRQYTMLYWAMADADILGPDLYGIGSLDNYLPNARSDNTIAYKGSFSGLTLGATYSFGRDSAGTGNAPGQGTCAGSVPGMSSACREWSAMIKYDAPWFGASVSYDEQRGGAGAAASFSNGVAAMPLTDPSDRDARLQVNGYTKLGNLRLGTGWIGRRVETNNAASPDVRSNLFYLGASYLLTPVIGLDGEVYRMINAQQDARATLATLRGTYFLSKRTAVYAQTAYLANSRHAQYSVSSGGPGATPPPGKGQLGVNIGIRHSF
ncbi:porin [Paraburkholderia dipogonis]|uniref:Porin n=1 Tax=Paraburkholderia dipogonis TaxID=1211383 RepID=A0A4Y8MKA0_9BURK|nr:porin [Paraburkholderia dipogonis]TFE37845.1 porin [Paraburkholderia dipogonis]